MKFVRWIFGLLPGNGGQRGGPGGSADSFLQIQVFYDGEGWQNAGLSPADPRTVRRRLDEALARHGGSRARAIDSDGRVISQS